MIREYFQRDYRGYSGVYFIKNTFGYHDGNRLELNAKDLTALENFVFKGHKRKQKELDNFAEQYFKNIESYFSIQ